MRAVGGQSYRNCYDLASAKSEFLSIWVQLKAIYNCVQVPMAPSSYTAVANPYAQTPAGYTAYAPGGFATPGGFSTPGVTSMIMEGYSSGNEPQKAARAFDLAVIEIRTRTWS